MENNLLLIRVKGNGARFLEDRAQFSEGNMSTIETFFAPETLRGPYAEFYRRAITELICWRMLRDGNDHVAELREEDPTDPLALDAIGIQFGEA
jgi:hypothetical protein